MAVLARMEDSRACSSVRADGGLLQLGSVPFKDLLGGVEAGGSRGFDSSPWGQGSKKKKEDLSSRRFAKYAPWQGVTKQPIPTRAFKNLGPSRGAG